MLETLDYAIWVEGYPVPELIFTERLYEEKLSLLAG